MIVAALVAVTTLAGSTGPASSVPAPPALTAGQAAETAVVVTAVRVTPGKKSYSHNDVFSSLDPSDKVLCRTEELTGSRLASYRVCMTKANWDARSRGSGGLLSHIQGSADTSILVPY